MKLSICIPTYNRSQWLTNCLESIRIASLSLDLNVTKQFEVCISDNGSSDETQIVISEFLKQSVFRVKTRANLTNQGIVRNFLDVVQLAEGEFVWLIGDDDLLMPDAIIELLELFNKNPTVDFFYVNAYNMPITQVKQGKQPFDTKELPKNLERFSSYKKNGELPFLRLIDKRISFDFLGGMFLSVFRREGWLKSVHFLDPIAINDKRTFSNFDNTFPHVKIFAYAFSDSKAYFNSEPLIVSLSGVREWEPLQSMVMNIRLIEALNLYRARGLGLFKYLECKNYALRSFLPQLAWMVLNKKVSGIELVPLKKVLIHYAIYPNFYFSLLYYFLRKINGVIKSTY